MQGCWGLALTLSSARLPWHLVLDAGGRGGGVQQATEDCGRWYRGPAFLSSETFSFSPRIGERRPIGDTVRDGEARWEVEGRSWGKLTVTSDEPSALSGPSLERQSAQQEAAQPLAQPSPRSFPGRRRAATRSLSICTRSSWLPTPSPGRAPGTRISPPRRVLQPPLTVR